MEENSPALVGKTLIHTFYAEWNPAAERSEYDDVWLYNAGVFPRGPFIAVKEWEESWSCTRTSLSHKSDKSDHESEVQIYGRAMIESL